MIKLSDLSVSFGEKKVLQNLNLSFADGGVHCILGPSGSGKTTLLNAIAGNVSYDGTVSGVSGGLSYVFQEPRLIPEMTVGGNLNFVLGHVYEKEKRNQIVDKYLDIVGLLGEKKRYPHELSGGMAQRVSLARAFSYPAEIILMDEPFKALDLKLKTELIDAFFSLLNSQNRTAIFVTHDIDECLLLGDTVSVFSDLPLTLVNRYEIDLDRAGRKLYDPKLAEIKNSIYKDIESWSV